MGIINRAYRKFTDLLDTFSYSGQGGKSVRVRADETGLEAFTPADVDGGSSYTTVTVTGSTYSITSTTGKLVILCNYSSGICTLTLPTAVGNTAEITVKKIDTSLYSVQVNTLNSETIDADTSKTLQYKNTSITLISNNINWLMT